MTEELRGVQGGRDAERRMVVGEDAQRRVHRGDPARGEEVELLQERLAQVHAQLERRPLRADVRRDEVREDLQGVHQDVHREHHVQRLELRAPHEAELVDGSPGNSMCHHCSITGVEPGPV